MTKGKMPVSVPWEFEEQLYEDLKDPVFAADYINGALLDGDDIVFKVAVLDVIRARGVVKVAK